jgi:isopentenyl phosphate kinase
MDNLVIIKFGGSSITKKSENLFEMNYELLERIVKEFKEGNQNTTSKFIIICGVGPFGHTNVRNFQLTGKIEGKEKLFGVEKTMDDCDFVGEEVSRILSKYDVQSKYIPAYDIAIQDNGNMRSFDQSPYVNLIEQGVIPISTGIMVKDITNNWSVVSGDTIIAELTKTLLPKQILMGTDVDGIFTDDPKKNSEAELITEITLDNIENLIMQTGESSSIDVTGGMRGKLEKLSNTVNGIPTKIFNLFTPGNLKELLLGRNIKCTTIEL